MELPLKIALQAAIAMLMVSLGLETPHQALLQLWRRPRLLAGCLIAAFVVVPVAAYLVIQLIPLSYAARAGIWVVAITPGAPMIYRGAIRRGTAQAGLAASFQVTVGLLVIVLAPMWLATISLLTGGEYRMPAVAILRQVATIQLIPILIGLGIHNWLPGAVEVLGRTLAKVGNLTLLGLVVALLVVLGPRVVTSTALWTVLAVVVVAGAAVAGGHCLAGPDPSSRLTIGKANAQRNLGLALAIAGWNLPEQMPSIVLVVAVYVMVSLLVAAVYTNAYTRLRGDRHSDGGSQPR